MVRRVHRMQLFTISHARTHARSIPPPHCPSPNVVQSRKRRSPRRRVSGVGRMVAAPLQSPRLGASTHADSRVILQDSESESRSQQDRARRPPPPGKCRHYPLSLLPPPPPPERRHSVHSLHSDHRGPSRAGAGAGRETEPDCRARSPVLSPEP